MRAHPTELEIEAALESERQFVLTLGGFALEVAGACLVTHERIPAPRFNFVQELGVGAERQTAFFERALDHYFQRALRPTFRVPEPAPAHVDRGLRALGFVAREAPLVLLLEDGSRPEPEPAALEVRPAELGEIDRVLALWADERERPELRAALEVAWAHPNPHERLVPLLAALDGTPVAAAIAYRYRGAGGLHFVATQPTARGQGAASSLVRFAVRERPLGQETFLSIFAGSPRLLPRLRRLGFAPARRFVEYELPHGAELALPRVGPPSPARWRPPRGDRGSTAR